MGMKVLIVEDEPALRFYAVRGLEKAGWDAHEADCGEAALVMTRTTFYDVILLDLHLGGIDGVSVMRKIKARWPETIVIIITAYASVDSAIEGIRQGASDYLRKPLTVEEILACIQHILDKKRVLEQHAQHQQTATTVSGNSNGDNLPDVENIPDSLFVPETGETLTCRELQVLALLGSGATNRTIAEHLYITPKTVKNHINRINRKLNASSRGEATFHAQKLGLI